ncbi:MAG: hypothetical protein H6640_00935 [Caldilineaceae bacterium]|nr:hypothetical protein [Caldilineaceae bacterium]
MSIRRRMALSRRDALKLALATGVVAAPAILGGRVLLESRGEAQPNADVFVSPPAPGAGASPLVIVLPAGTPVTSAEHWHELLRVEGLPYAQVIDVAALDRASMGAAAAIILLPGAIDHSTLELLRDFVMDGGGLVAVQPDTSLLALCGLEALPERTDHGYLCVRSSAASAAGIATGALQFHAPLIHTRAVEAEPVAWLCDAAGVATTIPAATVRRLGSGMVVAWSYDLAESVVLTRQGDPALAGDENDGLDGVRACELFAGFVDLDRIAVPQADEQQRLFVNLLNEVAAAGSPLPRLWYFPDNADSMLICTGDSHNNPAYAVEDVLQRVERFGGAMSIYYTPPPTSTVRRAVRRIRNWAEQGTPLGEILPQSEVVTPYHADAWRARGHEFALHPYVEEGLEAGWARYWEQFTGLGFGAFDTTRTHRVLWHGWAETARVQAGYGVGMNLDYYHVGPTFQRADGSWAFGYFTGSGLPMRFVNDDGRLLSIWQQTTQLVDEQLIAMPWGANFTGVDTAEAIEIAGHLVRMAAGGAYAALGGQFHVDPFAVPGPWTEPAGAYLVGVLAACAERNVPIWSGAAWHDFARARAEGGFDRIEWQAEFGTLQVEIGAQTEELVLMLPLQCGTRRLAQLQVNGKENRAATRQVGATLYSVVVLEPGASLIDARYHTA